MTTMDVTSGFPTQPIWQDLVGAQIAGWQTFLRRREEHRRVAAISRLGPRLIRDMGLDPERIHEALEGTLGGGPAGRFPSSCCREMCAS